MPMILNPKKLARPTQGSWYPYNDPDSPLCVTITENKRDGVVIQGLDIPPEQLEGLCELLGVWKYGLHPAKPRKARSK